MAPMKKKVPKSDPQKYSEWFPLASPNGNKFELPNNSIPTSSGSSAPNRPINPSHPFFNMSQSQLLSPFPRPSQPRRYYGNNYLNHGQPLRTLNNVPLATYLSDGTNFPMGNPNDHLGHFEANPNRSMSWSQMGYPHDMRTFHCPLRNHPFSSGPYATTTQMTKYHFYPNIGESSTITTPIIPFHSNISSPLPRSAPSLDLHPLQAHKTSADLPGFGDNLPGPPLPARIPESFFPNFVCPACNRRQYNPVLDPRFLSSYLATNVFRSGPPLEGAGVKSAPLQRPNDVINGPLALGEDQRNDNNEENINLAKEDQGRRVFPSLECNATLPSGNALGGHMSSHARKRKRDFMNSFQKAPNPPPEDGEFFEFIDVALGVNNNGLNNHIGDVAAVAPLLGNPPPPAAAAAAVTAESASIEDAGGIDEELSSSSSRADMGPAGRGLN